MSAPLPPVKPSATRVEMTEIVLPPHTNNHGTAFGGQIAAWTDICASVAARRFCKGPVVTVSMDQLHFLMPVKLGMIVVLRGQVNQSWRTSMEIGVRIETEDSNTGERAHCCTAYLTFVALDEAGQPRPVPSVDTSDDPDAARRAADAILRRESRLQVRAMRRSHM